MIVWLVFIVVLGACIGSFLNVVAYRLPEGRSLVNPPSACPKCEHRLAWYDNVPVLGWLWLRGKCRYCKAPISAQYPAVEAVTGLLFGGWYAVCYMSPMRPGFGAILPATETAMLLFIGLALIAALVVATVIDARLFIIPLQIPWLITAIAIVLIPLSVALFPGSVREVKLPPAIAAGGPVLPKLRLEAVPSELRGAADVRVNVLRQTQGPAIITGAPHSTRVVTAASIGGVIGLVIAIVLLWRGVLKMSFADDSDAPPEEEPLEAHDENVPQLLILLGPIVGVAVFSFLNTDAWTGTNPIFPFAPLLQGAAAGYGVVAVAMLLLAVFRRKATTDADKEPDDGVVFEPHPHTRREMMKEVLFLAFPFVGLFIGASLAPVEPAWPAWLHVFGGVLVGYLMGAGVVWAIRVLGSLLFGKEAMGLGDVHLMGAVGAVCGWEVAVAAFFMAAFLGVAHAILTLGLGPIMKVRGRQMPFGPQLAGATLIAMVWREPIATYFGTVLP